MCGRFTLASDLRALELRFNFRAEGLPHRARYNVAPTQEVLTVPTRRDSANRAEYMRWGLIPFWARDESVGHRMINARAEGVAHNPAFRNAFKRRRCLILADGFYEWRKAGKARVPIYMALKSREPFAFAGLWESWEPPSGEPVRSCTTITTDANELVAAIHDRMPVILSEEAERLWLDRELEEPAVLEGLLTPFPAGSMEIREVSPLVNSPKNESPECVVPVS